MPSSIISNDSETLADGQQVITACAFIHELFDGIEKVFLPRRAETKKFLPGIYNLPGGHIDFDENIPEGLKREIREEFNMKINVGDPFFVFTYTNNIKKSHSVEIIYFARFVSPIEKINLNANDHSDYKWLSQEEVKQLSEDKKNENKQEFEAITKAFELLNGQTLNFG